ncbi:hypothetical protein GFJ94_06310 [Flavobacterium sp. LMO8]|uniref:hypothetical protein n=1 Tax=Flavobacterium sp. LMO8 TaxID=2654244 RepID=UPI0012926E40|nr:hypothetical protein [Flavobacterium sp. LMO8]MQP24673.1 hypothetical protein [Flavobacterium sp. LMO8]
MKKVVLLFVLFVYSFSFAQDNYKYVIVPKKFSFFKEENKYNLNVMTKSFFETEGFQVYFETDEFPKELAENRCLALFVDPEDGSNMFTTKVSIELKDCYNKVLQTSDLGISKQKDFKNAYNEAFRKSLSSMKGLLNIKNTTVKSPEKVNDVMVTIPTKKPSTIINTSELRAIPTESGYTLVNYSDNVVMVLYSTSLDTVFLAGKENFKGVLLKKNSGWFFEYDFDGIVYSEKMEVKF